MDKNLQYWGKKYLSFVCVYLQRSIDLNPAQKDLVLKVAELLVNRDECDSRAEFWVEKASKLQPGNPAVFNLKVSLQFFSLENIYSPTSLNW